jgi:hypothetical protein
LLAFPQMFEPLPSAACRFHSVIHWFLPYWVASG